MTACHCSGFMRMMSVSRVMPALFTRMSTVPHLSTASFINLRYQPALDDCCGSCPSPRRSVPRNTPEVVRASPYDE